MDNDESVWLNEKHIEEGQDHKNLRVTGIKYLPDHINHRYGLVDEPKKQPNRMFIRKDLATKVIMNCRRQQHIDVGQD